MRRPDDDLELALRDRLVGICAEKRDVQAVSADTAANANPVAVPPTANDAPDDTTVAAVGAATMPFNSRPC